ncbi:MAG: hypothetical protein ABFR97_08655 [Thermodesulfobacteriota bacterium]
MVLVVRKPAPFWLSLTLLFIIFAQDHCRPLSAAAQAAESGGGPEEVVRLLQPAAGGEVIGKKPLIKGLISAPFLKEYLFVYLDGADVTGILDVSADGFSFKPAQVLMSGAHQLQVILYTTAGQEVQQAFPFTVKHSESFDDLLAVNQLTARYEGRLHKSDDLTSWPDSMLDANLSNSSLAKNGNWALALNTNIRYFDQDLPVPAPLHKGINVSNYLLKLERPAGQKYQFLAEVGDVQINESTSTLLNFARRGGKASLSYKGLTIGGFMVKADPLFGLRSSDDTGLLAGSDDDQLKGVSGSVGLFNGQALIKALTFSGGATGSGLGLYSAGGGSEGQVDGALLQTNFFNQKFVTEVEFYDSSFDGDVSDGAPAQDDKAYRLAGSGAIGSYSYQGAYEYMGRYYNIPGQAINNDRRGFLFNGSRAYAAADLALALSKHRNNVDDDPLMATADTSFASLNYNWRRFPRFPMGINYGKTILESTYEPPGQMATKIETDMAAATFSYLQGNLNLTLQPSYSIQNDRLAGNDSTSSALNLSTAYSKNKLAFSSALAFNRVKLDSSGEETDNYLANIQFQGKGFKELLSYGLVGSYNLFESSSGAKTEIFSTNCEVAYAITGHEVIKLLNPTIGFRSQYQKSKDHLFHTENEDVVILLVLTSSVPFTI